MRRVAFLRVGEPGVLEHMKLWGPIPRLVLAMPLTTDQHAVWARAAAVPLEKLSQVARIRGTEAVGAGDLSELHGIVHQRAAGQDAKAGTDAADPSRMEYYMRGSVVVGSAALLRYVAERISAGSLWQAAYAAVGIAGSCAFRGSSSGSRGLHGSNELDVRTGVAAVACKWPGSTVMRLMRRQAGLVVSSSHLPRH